MRDKAKTWRKLLESQEGYFTVEASFLVPIFCFLVVGVMMISLYLCDLNLAKSCLNQKVTEWSEKQTEITGSEQTDDREWLQKKLLVCKIDEYKMIKTEWKVTGEITLSMQLQIPIAGDWMGELWKQSFQFTSYSADNVKWIRRWNLSE